jgi:hypothetical protein
VKYLANKPYVGLPCSKINSLKPDIVRDGILSVDGSNVDLNGGDIVYMDKVNKWLTLVANFGVIVGLVLVAMQMKLATEAINQQSDIELSRGIAEGELAFMGETTANAWAVAMFNPAQLDEVQIGQLWAYLNNTLLFVQQTWLSNRAGMASDATWERARKMGATYLSFGAAQIWWREYKYGFDSEFAKEIDSELAKVDQSNNAAQVTRRMLEEIHKLEQGAVTTPTS